MKSIKRDSSNNRVGEEVKSRELQYHRIRTKKIL